MTYFPSNCVDVFPDGAFYTNLLINSLSCGTFVTEHLPQFYSQDEDDDDDEQDDNADDDNITDEPAY